MAGIIRERGAAIGNEMVAVEATISSKSKLLQRTITSIFGRGAARPLRALATSRTARWFSHRLRRASLRLVLRLSSQPICHCDGEAINKTRDEAVKAGMAYDEYVKKQGWNSIRGLSRFGAPLMLLKMAGVLAAGLQRCPLILSIRWAPLSPGYTAAL